MERITPKTMRGALASGGSGWTPILPPGTVADPAARAYGAISAAPVNGSPDTIGLAAGQRENLKRFRDF